jgi:hypothetical protein
VEFTDHERGVLLAGLFELWLTRTFGDDPRAAQAPFTRITHDDILGLVQRLDGDPDTASFGAFPDEWADRDAPVPEYPPDETDDG